MTAEPLPMNEPIHLCCPPAKAELSDYWECECDSAWLFVCHLASRVPDWIRLDGSSR